MTTSVTGLLGGLPAAEIVTLHDAQLDLAVAEVRFSRTSDEPIDAAWLVTACAEAGLRLPVVEPLRQPDVSITVAAGVAPTATTQRTTGWQLASADQSLTVNVLPEALVIQNARYRRWSTDLGEPLSALLHVLAGQPGAPSLAQRVGLRYINRLRHPGATNPQSWRRYIAPSLLGPIGDPDLGRLVVATQQQVQLSLEETAVMVVRHGAYTEPGTDQSVYLVDIDTFDQAAAPFDPEGVLGTAVQLNRAALSVYQRIVLPEYRDTLNPQAIITDEG